jgi:hypothetical protein
MLSLYQYVDEHNHAVDLVYEAGCCGFSAAYFKLGWNVLVVNPDVREEIKALSKNRCLRF